MNDEDLRAIIIEKDNEIEIRCRNCGKLLFKINLQNKDLRFHVDKTKPYAIIVSRCTRTNCKIDNKIYINV